MNLNSSDEGNTSSDLQFNNSVDNTGNENLSQLSLEQTAEKFIKDLKSLIADSTKSRQDQDTQSTSGHEEGFLSAEKIRGCIEKQRQLELEASKLQKKLQSMMQMH